MTGTRPPAIAGVSASKETLSFVVYPSIAATGLGQLIGRICESLPMRVGGGKLSHLIFALPLAPLGASLYLLLKLVGTVYVLTNRSIQLRKSLGNRLVRSVPLKEIDQVILQQEPGQEFFPAADVYLINKAGNPLAVLPGVTRADVFRRSILEARDSTMQVDASLATIRRRGS
jgi:Bacterial PH domain